jgi:Protein of unknown function (DUF982)
MSGRLRECLKILRWHEAELADASGHDLAEVKAWLDGRQYPPLAVAAWLEALVKAHLSIPPLRNIKSAADHPVPRRGHKTSQLPFEPIVWRRTMEHNLFQRPVTMLVGLGFPTEIRSVKEAYAMLGEWPPSKRDAAHAIALSACRAALAGEIDAETARGMLVAFARRADLLAPDAGDVPAARKVGAFGAASGGLGSKSM